MWSRALHYILGIGIIGLIGAACKKSEGTSASAYEDPTVSSACLACPAWAANANIYEVNIRQYTPEGNFKAFAAHLPRLKQMGVDILWLMPVFPISEANRKGTLGSYYAVADFTAINPNYGTLDEFKALVDTIHQLGMKVILDWVPNHTGWDHVWITQHRDYYTQNKSGKITDPIAPKTGKSWGWTDVADLNYDNQDMRKAMTDAMLFWLREANIDGFRCDVAGEVPDDFWQQATPVLRQAKPDIFMLAEAEHAPHRNSDYFAMSYGWSFHHLMNEIAAGNANANDIYEWLKKDRSAFGKGYHMHFITNHDENSWNGTEFERMGDAVDAMAVLSCTFDGMPLLYSGQESAFNRRLAFFEKDSINWGNYSKAAFYTALLNLKHRNKALWNGPAGGKLNRLATSDDKSVFAYYREKDGQRVVVILNLSNKPRSVKIDAAAIAGNYTDLFSEQSVKLATKNQPFELKAWGYQVLEGD